MARLVDRFNIPFSLQGIPVGNFVGREEQLHRIEQQLQPASTEKTVRKVFVVHGLGGIGKTQLAAKFARNHQDEYGAIFWIDGSSRTRLQQSFLDAVKRVPRQQLQANVVAALESPQSNMATVMTGMLQWLSLPRNWRWLLIIDNVDQEFSGPGKDEQGFDPRDVMPEADHGSILFTTRLSTLQGIGGNFHLGRVNDIEAKEILERHAGRSLQGGSGFLPLSVCHDSTTVLTLRTDIHLLIMKLDGLPLALAQAGSFIGMADLDVQTYVSYFDKTWSDLMQKQDDFPVQGYERSMLTTWKISYEKVLRQSETAAWLLRLWAFFYHDDFWYGLLAKSHDVALNIEEFEEFKLPSWLAKISGSELEFSSAMGLLKAYSLVDSRGAGSYTMHSVLHLWSRSLSLDADTGSLISISVGVLASVTPSQEDDEYWKLDRRLLPHVLHALNELRSTQTAPPGAVHRLGDLLTRQGKLNKAEQMYDLALAGREEALGPDSETTLNTVNNLGALYREQRKLDKAEHMLLRALVGREKALGPTHPSTLDTVNDLGALYRDQGRLDEAEQMIERSLAGREKAFGPGHTSTLVVLNNLGVLYHAQQRMDEAEQVLQRALAGRENAIGLNHTSTINTVSNLGILYHTQGKLDKAEQMFRRALVGYEKTLGTHHNSTIATKNNWITVLGKLDEAKRMHDRGDVPTASTDKLAKSDQTDTSSIAIGSAQSYLTFSALGSMPSDTLATSVTDRLPPKPPSTLIEDVTSPSSVASSTSTLHLTNDGKESYAAEFAQQLFNALEVRLEVDVNISRVERQFTKDLREFADMLRIRSLTADERVRKVSRFVRNTEG
jgi:tetratricopeptide (TPR) repeat protein